MTRKFHWSELPPDWRGRSKITSPLRWGRLPEFDVGVALVQQRTDYGHENRWFLYFRRFNENDVKAFPVLAQTVITSSPGSTQSIVSDATWNNNSNLVEVIGGGAAGAHGASTSTSGGGGGGGAYSRIVNASIATPGTTRYRARVGIGGTADGQAGGDSWWDLGGGSPDIFPSSGTAVGARGGGGPFASGSPDVSSATGAFGGMGGSAGRAYTSPATGAITKSGGKGGNAGASNASGGGGGGAGGEDADGLAGGNGPGTGGDGNGGTVNLGGGGGAPGSPGNQGGSGTNLGGSNGSGGGGGGANAGPGTGGNGGSYGGGAGGGGRSNGAGGDGFQGLVLLTWLPDVQPGLVASDDLIQISQVDLTNLIYSTFLIDSPLVRRLIRPMPVEVAAAPLQSQNLSPSLVDSDDAFYSPDVASIIVSFWTVEPVRSPMVRRLPLAVAAEFSAPPVQQQNLFPSFFDDTDVFFSPTVVGATVWTPESLVSPLFRRPKRRRAVSVEVTGPQQQNLFPSLFNDADTFFAPTVFGVAPAVTFSFATSSSLYRRSGPAPAQPTLFIAPVAGTPQDISPPLFVDDDTFYAPTVTAQPIWGAVLYSPLPVTRRFVAGTDFTLFIATPSQDVAPPLFDDTDVFFSPTVVADVSFWTPETLASPLFKRRRRRSIIIEVTGPQEQDLFPSFFDDTDTFFSPTVVADVSFWTPETLVSPLFKRPRRRRTFSADVVTPPQQDLFPSFFSDDDVFYSPSIALQWWPGDLASRRTKHTKRVLGAGEFGAPPVPQSVDRDIDPPLFDDTDIFFTPAIDQTSLWFPDPLVSPRGKKWPRRRSIAQEITFYGQQAQNLFPSFYDDTDIFFAPTVLSINDIQPPLFDDTDIFFAPTVTQTSIWYPEALASPRGRSWPRVKPFKVAHEIAPAVFAGADQALFPSFYDDTDIFFTPVVTQTSIWYPPALVSARGKKWPRRRSIAQDISFYGPQIQNLFPSLYDDTDIFYSPTVGSSGNISPPLYVDTDVFYSPTITYVIFPTLFTDTDIFFSPTLTYGLFPQHFTDEAIYFPVMSGGFHSPTDSDRIIFPSDESRLLAVSDESRIIIGDDQDRIIIAIDDERTIIGDDPDRIIIAVDGSQEIVS